jgi:tetratricopeptide (TPR) repeat protein
MNFKSQRQLLTTTTFCFLAVSWLAEGQEEGAGLELKGLPEELVESIRRGEAAETKAREVDGKDPVGSGSHFLDLISGDSNLESHLRLRYVEALLENDRVAEAEKVAGGIRDYRSAVGALLVLEKRLIDGPVPEGREVLEKLGGELAQWKVWQQEVLRVRLASVGALAGMSDQEMAGWLAGYDLGGDRLAAVALAYVQRVRRGEAFTLEELKRVMSDGFSELPNAPVPELVEAAGKLFQVVASEAAGKRAEQEEQAIFEGVSTLLERSHAYHADVLLDMAKYWMEQKREEEARVAFEKAFGQLGFHLEGGGERYLKMAEIWKMRGKEEALKGYFEKLETLARSQQPMDQPGTLAWTGACFTVLGMDEKADKLFLEAVRIASVNPNPRMKYRGCYELCLCHARLGRPIGPELQAALNAVLRGEVIEPGR